MRSFLVREHRWLTRGDNVLTMAYRVDTSDWNTITACTTADEYGLGAYSFHDGDWALDVGAHVGGVAVSLALDNPGLQVLAVEPVPENVALLRRNAALNGVEDRVHVVEAAAAAPGRDELVPCWYRYTRWNGHDPNYVFAHRFIGNQYRAEGEPVSVVHARAVSLGRLLDEYDVREADFMKVDCEGGEWEFLDTTALSRARVVVGEMHCGYESAYHPAWATVPEVPGHHRCPDEVAHVLELFSMTHLVTVDLPRERFEAHRLPGVGPSDAEERRGGAMAWCRTGGVTEAAW